MQGLLSYLPVYIGIFYNGVKNHSTIVYYGTVFQFLTIRDPVGEISFCSNDPV